MNEGMKLYYDYTVSPLGRLFYRTVFKQLGDLHDKSILDFGSGFGFTSDFLAKRNTVTSIEKDAVMIDFTVSANGFTQIHGDLESIKKMADACFDVVICHLVLEFVENPTEILTELIRVLKKGGIVSIVRHNKNGRVIQAIVQDYDLSDAKNLLCGGYSHSSAFGDIKYYTDEDLMVWTAGALELNKVFGVRTLASLHDNHVQTKDDWLSDMLEIESTLCEHPDYMKIAYFNHLILVKL